MTVSEDSAVSQSRLSGWVLKGSDVVNSLAYWRYGVLEEKKFLYYRSEKDEKPSALWTLFSTCEISRLEQKDMHVRPKGKNTIVALVSGRSGKIESYQFSVTWPVHYQPKSGKGNRLVLGFQEETTAARWQTAFLQLIEKLKIAEEEEAEIVSPPLPMDSSPLHSNALYGNDNLIDLESSRRTKLIPGEESQVTNEPSFYDVEPFNRSLSFCSSMAGEELCENSSHRTRNYGFWTPWKHVNGVAVYKEDDSSEGVEAFMVSTIVRSSPSTCFCTLMAGNKEKSTTGRNSDFLDMEVIDKIDENVDLVRGCLAPRGWIASFLARRDIVLERNWRQDEEDGPYTIVLKSTDKFITEDLRKVETQKDTIGQRIWDPVIAKVIASVFTIAPLKEKYYKNGSESPEALVTMVLKLDFGGILSPANIFYPLSQIFCIKDSWVESILMTVVSLRDRVEQSRFMSSPFAMDSSYITTEKHAAKTDGGDNPSSCQWTEKEKEDLSALNASSTCAKDDQAQGAESSNNLPIGMNTVTRPELRPTGTCDPSYWTCPGAASYRVRGPTYLTDKKKILAPEPVFDLHSVDLVKISQPTKHMARFLTSVKECPFAFAFVLQIMVPGPPHLSLVVTWGSKDDTHPAESSSMNIDQQQQFDAATENEQEMLPFEVALMKFVTGDDEVRNSTFKLIPHIMKGSFIIRQSVGSTPVLLGHKLKQYYFRTPRYIEVDIDVGSSYAAATVVNMVSGVTKSLIVDLAIVLEGTSPEELPEALLGTVRLDHLDLATAIDLDVTEENVESGNGVEKESIS